MSESPEKRYSKSDLNDLKARIDLAALVGQTVELKRVGKNLMGICPLHPDEKPSLSVNGQLWKCFGCDAGGDVVEWIRLKEKLEFPQIKARMLELANQLPDAEPSSPKPPTELGVRFSRTGLPPETFARLYKRLANTGLGQVKPIIGPSLLSLVGNPYTQKVKRLLSLLLVALTLWSLAFPALAMNLEIPKHPSTARMRVRPKLGEGVDLNLYRYCGNLPSNFSDPDGLETGGYTSTGGLRPAGSYNVPIGRQEVSVYRTILGLIPNPFAQGAAFAIDAYTYDPSSGEPPPTPVMGCTANRKPYKQYGHGIDKHGAQNTEQLTIAAARSGKPKGQWLDNAEAAKFIDANAPASGQVLVPIPPGLGRVINPDGSMIPATHAIITRSTGGTIKTAFPKNP